jgi:hypothetical protein
MYRESSRVSSVLTTRPLARAGAAWLVCGNASVGMIFDLSPLVDIPDWLSIINMSTSELFNALLERYPCANTRLHLGRSRQVLSNSLLSLTLDATALSRGVESRSSREPVVDPCPCEGTYEGYADEQRWRSMQVSLGHGIATIARVVSGRGDGLLFVVGVLTCE